MKTTKVKIWGGMHEAYADAEGVVRVYDSVAGHYTTCHSLSDGQQRRVRALASESPAATLGRKGGQANTPAQNVARAENGRKGGRPRKTVDGVVLVGRMVDHGTDATWYPNEASATKDWPIDDLREQGFTLEELNDSLYGARYYPAAGRVVVHAASLSLSGQPYQVYEPQEFRFNPSYPMALSSLGEAATLEDAIEG